MAQAVIILGGSKQADKHSLVIGFNPKTRLPVCCACLVPQPFISAAFACSSRDLPIYSKVWKRHFGNRMNS